MHPNVCVYEPSVLSENDVSSPGKRERERSGQRKTVEQTEKTGGEFLRKSQTIINAFY